MSRIKSECNDLFSRFEQQILFLEKLSESTEPTTDRRGGLVPKHLEFWNLGTEIDSLNFVTKWQDGPSQTLGKNLVSELCDGSSRTDRRRHDGPSQAT